MHAVFNPPPRGTLVSERPKTVSFLDTIKSSSSNAFNGHDYKTSSKLGPRDRRVLQQRYVGYPVCVPDVSKDAVEETMLRRTAHQDVYQMTEGNAFRKNFYPECTSDVFHQKHLVRHYLATMHPYSDPLDTGRTYTQSRLKSGEQKLSNQEASNGFGVVDFLQPEDPTRPRSVGYSKGHVRNLLKLDVYGEKSSEEARVQREMGRLPPSPNIDRYKTLGGSRGSVSTASTASSTSDQRRPRTIGHEVQSDPLDLYLPLQQHNTTVRLPTDGGGAMESNNFAVLGLVPATPDPAVHIKSAKGQETRKRNVVPPGTLGYAGPAINKEDVSLVDAHARGVEYFNSVLSRKWRKTQTKLSKAMKSNILKSTLAEARSAMDHIQEFEQNLEIIKSKPRPI